MTPEENDLLCRVEGNAPMGQIMRRHWVAACLSEEVAERDGAPVRVRLLGENLVVFRDSEGRLGVLDEYCPHRRPRSPWPQRRVRPALPVSRLEVRRRGQRRRHGLRTAEDQSRRNGCEHKAYPAREGRRLRLDLSRAARRDAGIRAARLGANAGRARQRAKVRVHCNWAQIMEGQIDSAHSSSLHSSDMVPAQVEGAKATDVNWLRPSTDKAPRIADRADEYGFRYAAIRRPIKNETTHDYVRITRLHRAVHRARPAKQCPQCRDAR